MLSSSDLMNRIAKMIWLIRVKMMMRAKIDFLIVSLFSDTLFSSIVLFLIWSNFQNWSSQCWSFSCRRVSRSSWFWSWFCLSEVVLEISIKICFNKILYDVRHEFFLHHTSSYFFFRSFDEIFFLKCLIQEFCNDDLLIF